MEFAEALRPASASFETDVYGAREAPLPGVDGQSITMHLNDHPHAALISGWKEMAGRIRAREVPAGVLLTLGAGDITDLGPWLMGEQA